MDCNRTKKATTGRSTRKMAAPARLKGRNRSGLGKLPKPHQPKRAYKKSRPVSQVQKETLAPTLDTPESVLNLPRGRLDGRVTRAVLLEAAHVCIEDGETDVVSQAEVYDKALGCGFRPVFSRRSAEG